MDSQNKLVKLEKVHQIEVSSVGSQGAQPTPVKILKTESTFAKSYGQKNSNNPPTKKLAFADEIGNQIAENVFIEHLHYSSNGSTNTDMPKGCCLIS